MGDAMLFPPTAREEALAEARRALVAEMDRLCRATREACECAGDGTIGVQDGACAGCPRHAVAHIEGVMDRLARRQARA